jgi:superfamily II DNA/RNA helicase
VSWQKFEARCILFLLLTKKIFHYHTRIENGLLANAIKCTWLAGEMSITQRDRSLDVFRGNAECNVLLGSITAAGVGIDLRCAQNVYIMVSMNNRGKNHVYGDLM